MWICGRVDKKLRTPNAHDKAYGKGRGLGIDYWTEMIYNAVGDGLLNFRFKSILVSEHTCMMLSYCNLISN